MRIKNRTRKEMEKKNQDERKERVKGKQTRHIK